MILALRGSKRHRQNDDRSELVLEVHVRTDSLQVASVGLVANLHLSRPLRCCASTSIRFIMSSLFISPSDASSYIIVLLLTLRLLFRPSSRRRRRLGVRHRRTVVLYPLSRFLFWPLACGTAVPLRCQDIHPRFHIDKTVLHARLSCCIMLHHNSHTNDTTVYIGVR